MASEQSQIKSLLDEGKYEEAERVAAAGLDTFTSQDDKAGIVNMMLASSQVALAQLQAARALKGAREAWPLARKVGDKSVQADILLAMVSAWNLQGSAKEALKAANSSMSLMQSDSQKASLLHGMATANLKLQEADDALEAEEKAVKLYKDAKDKQGEASSMANIAKAQCFLGRYDQATSTANSAIEIFRKEGNGAGVAACVETIMDVQAAKGVLPQNPLATADEELEKLQKAGCNTKNELIMMEKMAQVAADNGLNLDSCRILEDMITVCQKAQDKLLEAQKTMRAAQVHAEMNHVQDALRLGQQAQGLFTELDMSFESEEARKLQTSQYVKKNEYGKAPHRESALGALRSFVKAAEERDVAQVKQFEVDLDKFTGSVLKDSEMTAAFESLFDRDPAALGWLEQQGWDLGSFKVPTQIYNYPHKAFYLTQLAGGMGFGPQFRAVNPWRKGMMPEINDPKALSCCFLPETESWQGQLMFRHGVMDAGLQSQAVFGFPPFQK